MSFYSRTFSVIRRRNNIVDLVTPFVYGVALYRLKWSANFDGVFTGFLDSSNVGFRDPNIAPNKVEVQQTNGVRIVFDPATYSIPDTAHIWLELFTVDAMAVETQVSAPTLLLPEAAHHGVGMVTIHGGAPNGAASANSLQVDLPRLMYDFRIHNEDAANNLFVSTEAGGPESMLKPDTFPQFSTFQATQGSLFVRGGGATVPFSAVFTLAFPKLSLI